MTATARFIPRTVECLRPFVDAGVLGMVEVHVVATFVDVLVAAQATGSATRAVDAADPIVSDDVVLAAALAVRGPLHGHVCVDLADVATSIVPEEPADEPTAARADLEARDDEGPDLDLPALDGASDTLAAPDPVDLPWPSPVGWAGRVLASPLARAEGEEPGDLVEPLVVQGSMLYLDRYWSDEVAVAADLIRRAAVHVEADPAELAALDRYLPPEEPGAGPDLQRTAALAALEHQLVVVAGGPGTGKTRTVARLLAVLASSGDPDAGDGPDGVDDRPLEIALAAPTGKAAARLEEALGAAIRDARPSPEVAARLGSLDARTVHRLLGARRGGASFSRHAGNPIAADVLVVDEVSMVSLPLMARMLEAVRPDARVVLVGDPFQLASVEAGAVLGDLVGRHGGGAPARLQANVVTLERVYRFGEHSPVGRLASAVKAGDAERVMDLLRAGAAADPATPVDSPGSSDGAATPVDAPGSSAEAASPDERSPDDGSPDDGSSDGGPWFDEAAVRWVDPDRADEIEAVRSRVLAHAVGLVELGRAGRTDDALGALGATKVLCATRRGPLGVDEWNRWVEQQLRAGGRMRERWSAGRPVMVTANDYLNGVFNGDVGVVVRLPADPGGPARVQVAFDGPDRARLMDPSRLDRVETQWAMTIHKSQGSEFDHVLVTLPPPPSPILTRELLYTAVTRAKRGVTLVATEASVRAAVGRPVARSSGLAGRLA